MFIVQYIELYDKTSEYCILRIKPTYLYYVNNMNLIDLKLGRSF